MNSACDIQQGSKRSKYLAVIGKMFGLCLPPTPKIFFKFSGRFGAEGHGFFKLPVTNLFNNSFQKCTCDIYFYKSMMIPLE